jgi:N-acylneuraminate cytidylyltransferase
MDSLVKSSGVLALIPARGGSKSIPKKNIRNFAGHPLVAYSIAAGLAAETVDRVIVSTDDEEIAVIARRYGAETPFLRPPEISRDDTPDYPVFLHALVWLEKNEGYRPELLVQLRPTSPLRRTWHIDQAVNKLRDRPDASAIRTVCIPFQNPFKMWRINNDGFLQQIMETDIHEAFNQPRQLLPQVYWQTGYVDVIWSRTVLERSSMTGTHILPLIINADEWIDIDTSDDWKRAERLIENGEIKLGDLGYRLVEKNLS